MVVREKKQKHCAAAELTQGDCWIGLSLAQESGLIMSMRVGKHTDAFLSELVANTEGKTDRKFWYTDDWGGYERVLPPKVTHIQQTEHAAFGANKRHYPATNGALA